MVESLHRDLQQRNGVGNKVDLAVSTVNSVGGSILRLAF